MSAPTYPKKLQSGSASGVRYQRADGVTYVGLQTARRLILCGIAMQDVSRRSFSIQQRMKPSKLGGKRFVVKERWGDALSAYVLIDPETNRRVASVREKEGRSGLGLAQ